MAERTWDPFEDGLDETDWHEFWTWLETDESSGMRESMKMERHDYANCPACVLTRKEQLTSINLPST
jgi:hypothetical protein